MNEWHKIETAPKNGTHILVFVPEEGDWSQADGRYLDLIYVVKWDGKNGDDSPRWLEASGEGFSTFPEATHWMPLPEPPQ